MPFIHTVKKKTALAVSPLLGASDNAEFEDYKQRLSSVKKSMIATVNSINENARRFNKLYVSIRNFSHRFVENYPVEEEETKSIARECAEESQELWDHFVEGTGDWAPYQKIHEQIRVYINEIRGVESKYSMLKLCKVEMERYQSKLDKIALSANQPESEGLHVRIIDMFKPARSDMDVRKSRNLLKLKRAKEKYGEVLAEVIAMQKLTYAKHEPVFRAALAAYWLAHSSHVSCLVKTLHKTLDFAQKNEKDMLKLDIANIRVDELVHGVPTSPVSTFSSKNSDVGSDGFEHKVSLSPRGTQQVTRNKLAHGKLI